jgi:hypothetical protein
MIVRKKIWDNQTHDTMYYGPTYYDKFKTSTAHLSVLGNDGIAVAVTTTINTVALISTRKKMQCFSVLLIFWYHSLWKKLVLSFFSYFENWDVFHLFYCDSLGKIFFILVEESITHLQYAIMKERINSYVSAVLSRCHKNIKTGKFQ